MRKLSLLLENRLDTRLADLVRVTDSYDEIDGILEQIRNPGRFDSRVEFQRHLREGSLLDVSVLASKALAIPSGEYAVWTTDAGHTVLMPTDSPRAGDVVTREAPQYELHTSHLLGSWNRISRTIAERQQMNGIHQRSQQGDESEKSNNDHFQGAPTEQPDGPYTFGSKVARTELWQAMKDRNMGDSELADAVGVDKSTISRLLRKVEQGQEEPGGRNPSAELAMKISRVLGVPIDLVMPPESELIGKKRTGTSGSGKHGTMGRSTNGADGIGHGNTTESRGRRGRPTAVVTAAVLERKIKYAASLMENLGVDPHRTLVYYAKRNRPLTEAGVTSKLLGAGAKAAGVAGRGLQSLSNHAALSNYRTAIKSMMAIRKSIGAGDLFANFCDQVIKGLEKRMRTDADQQEPGIRRRSTQPQPQGR